MGRTPLLLAVPVLVLLASQALAGTQSFLVYVDTDDNPATGCTATTSKGPFPGAELALLTTVTTSTTGAQVTGVQLLPCTGTAFGPAQTVDPGSWPVGIGNGDSGTAVIETYVPLAYLGSTSLIRVAVASGAQLGGTDSILVAPGGGPILISLGSTTVTAATVPLLSPGALTLLGLGLSAAGLVALRRRRPLGTALLCAVLLTVAATALAAAVLLDGQVSDWAGQQVRATDPKGNAPVDADLVSLYAQVDAGRLYFRIDADVRPDGAPPNPVVTLDAVPDQTVPTNTTLSLHLFGRSTDVLATLTYALTSGPSGAGVSPSGAFSFTPTQGQLPGPHSVTVKVQDQGGDSAQRTFHVNVVDHDHPPVLGVLTDDVTKVGASYTKTLVATDPDPGDTLTFTLLSGPSGMTLTGAQLSWTPAVSQLGSWPVEVKVTDHAGAGDSGLFHVEVPFLTAADDTYSVVLGQTLAVAAPGVLANDVDPLPGPLSATKLTGPDKGNVSAFAADGSFTYQAPATLSGPAFAPSMKFHLEGAAVGGSFTEAPLVVDVDGDGTPDIVVLSGAPGFGIGAIRGTDGSFLWTRPSLPPPYGDCSVGALTGGSLRHLAAADVDDSGHVSIVFPTSCGRDNLPSHIGGTNAARYAAIDARDGSFEWLSPPLGGVLDETGNPESLAAGTIPTIARLRSGETPSILVGRDLFYTDFAGKPECDQLVPGWPTLTGCRGVFVLDGRDGTVRQRMAAPYPGAYPMDAALYGNGTSAAVAADLDGDGRVEIVFGGTVFNNDGSVRWNNTDAPSASCCALSYWNGLGNFDDTPDIEVVRLEGGGYTGLTRLAVYKPDGRQLWALPMASTGYHGIPAVADVDGTGRPSVVFSEGSNVCAVDYQGNYKWCHDAGSTGGVPNVGYGVGLQVFDLDGDGVPEVIVPLEGEQLLFLDGATGNVKLTFDMAAANGAPFWPPYLDSTDYTGGPVVADVDGSGHAAIVSVWGGARRLDVVGSATNDWRPARKVFNQESYQVGAINDDGSIPNGFVNSFATPATNVFRNQAQVLAPVDPRLKSQTSFTYAASDGALTSLPGTVTITILPTNRPPRFVTTPPTRYLAPSTTFTYAAQAIDPDPGDTVTYSLDRTQGSNSNLCSIDPGSGLLSCPDFRYGDQGIIIAATDNHGATGYQTMLLQESPGPAAVPDVVGQAQDAAGATLTAAGFATGQVTLIDDPAPSGQVVQQSPAGGTSALLGSSVDLVVSRGPAAAPPPGPPPQLGNVSSIVVTPASSLRVAGENVACTAVAVNTDGTSTDVTNLAVWSSSNTAAATVGSTGTAHAVAAGTSLLTATAGGLTGSATLTVVSRTPGDVVPPTALITQPASGATVSGQTQVLGTATDASFLRYELAVALAGDTSFSVIGGGSTAVTAGPLGTFDPATLVNDQYTLRLTVFDRNGNQSVATTTVQVTGGQKQGLFTLTYRDLDLPAAGIPLTVTRTYDSRDKAKGDFGVGWRLGLQTLRLRTNRVPGTGWVRQLSGVTVGLTPTSEHKVSLTLPDGKVEEFDLVLAPTSGFGSLDATAVTGYAPRPGTVGQLQALGNLGLLILNAGVEDELVDDTTLNTFDPLLYRYTALDGTRIEISRTEGVKKVTDPNGNSVTFGPAGIIHSSGKGITFARDAQGRITQITDPMGNVQTYSYDGNGDLVSHTTATGDLSRYAYDSRHGLIDVVDPAGHHATRNEYDDTGLLIATTDANGNQVTFTHDPAARREVVRDRLGNPTVFDYDTAGNVTSRTDALGHVTTYTYDGNNNQLTETDPLGRVATRSYDGKNNVLTSTDFDGNTTTWTYNALGQALTVTDPEGRTTTNVYDASGNLTQTTDPEGGVTSRTYDAAGNRLTTTDGLGHVTTLAYDAAGNRTSETDPLGKTTTYTYDANGRRLTETDPAGNVTLLAHDASGRSIGSTDKLGGASSWAYSPIGSGTKVSGATDASGHVTAFQLDGVGNLTQTTFPDGSVASATYDAEGRRTSFTAPGGSTTLVEYDALGRVTKTTLPDGAFVLATYDAAGRLLTRTDERGNTTTTAYAPDRETITDALGHSVVDDLDSQHRVVKTTDALGHVTRFTYDSAGNLVRTTYPDGTFTAATYDAAKRQIAEIDQAGRTTQFAYDAAGRLARVTDAAGGITSYTYDALGDRLTITDANGHTTQMGYDALGHVVSRTLPSGKQESFTYDASGKQVSHTDFNAMATTFAYDALNRQTLKHLPDGTSVVSTYSAGGMRTQAGGDRYSYDSRGHLVQELKATGGTLDYTYDAAGNRTSVLTSLGATTYTYDALGRLASVTDATGTTTETYDAAGRQVSTSAPNGVTTAYAYDTLDRLVQVTNTGPGGLISSYSYTLGPNGNRLQVVEAGPATTGRTVAYTYDVLDRLIQEQITEPGPVTTTIGYGYDAVGNRTQMTRNGVTTNYTYDSSDRLLTETTGVVTVTSTYDDDGNLVGRSDGVTADTFVYDGESRLVNATGPGGIFSYGYDADGMRTARTAGGVTTGFLLDKNRELAQVLVESTGSSAVAYTVGDRLTGQRLSGGGAHFYAADGQGSTRQLTDAAGVVSDSYTYDAFGVPLATAGTTLNAYRYGGEQLDPGFGFIYLRARYLDPSTGRFLTTDPAPGTPSEPLTLHRYLYGNANPIRFSDPSGRASLAEVLVVSAISNATLAFAGDYLLAHKSAEQASVHAAWAGLEGAAFGLAIYGLFTALPAALMAGTAGEAGVGAHGIVRAERAIVASEVALAEANNARILAQQADNILGVARTLRRIYATRARYQPGLSQAMDALYETITSNKAGWCAAARMGSRFVQAGRYAPIRTLPGTGFIWTKVMQTALEEVLDAFGVACR